MGAFDTAPNEHKADQYTNVDDLLSRQNELLARLDADTTDAPAVTPDAAVVPPESERLAVPAGKTTIDFAEGSVRHESLGLLDVDVKRITEMSGLYDGRLDAELRSVYAYCDVPAQLSFGGSSQKHTLDSCNYYPIPSQSFEKVQIDVPLPAEFTLTASTQPDPPTTSGVAVHGDRYGEESGTLDSMTAVPMQPKHLHETHGNQFGKPKVHTISFSDNTLFVTNTTTTDTSAAAADVDVELRAMQNHHGTWRVIGTQTAVSDGETVQFDTGGSRHHLLQVRVTNSATGNTVAARVEHAGGAP